MTKPSITNQVKRWRLILKRSQFKGFTLIELLVSIVIAGIITILLLSLVVQLTQTNQDDAARSQVQQDMQIAMDYIVQDLREAVFVYNGQCLQGNGTPANQNALGTTCPGIRNHIPTFMSASGKTPVLAFWRTKPIPSEIQTICQANINQLETLTNVPCVSGTVFSLVVYALDTDKNGIWKGNSRLLRYELSQFPENPASVTDTTSGYFNPQDDPSYSFQQWPYGKLTNGTFGNRQGGTLPTNPAFTLVDFVDATGAVDQAGNKVTPSCEEFAPFPGGNPSNAKTAIDIANALSPLDAPNVDAPNVDAPNVPRGFYACVRNGGVGEAIGAGQNQDVLLTLIGNVTGKGGFSSAYDNKNRLSPLQTRVLVRGAIKKTDAA